MSSAVSFPGPEGYDFVRSGSYMQEPFNQVMCMKAELVTHLDMRTNIVIDDKLMEDVLRSTGIKTKREAVEQGLRSLLRLSEQAKFRELRGKLHWEGDLDAMRRDR